MADQANGNIFESSESATGDQPQAEAQPQVPEFLSGLVGEGKKYSSVEVAMQSIPSAQDHISKLEQENADLRNSLAEAQDLKSIVQQNMGDVAPATAPEVTPSSADDIGALIDERMAQRSQQEQVANNLNAVDHAMRDKYGDKAPEMVASKAAELGVGVEFLQNTASASPKAFLQLFGLADQQARVTPSHVQSSVNTEAMGNQQRRIQPGTKSYYDELRRSNRSKYYSPEVQMQKTKDMLNPDYNN